MIRMLPGALSRGHLQSLDWTGGLTLKIIFTLQVIFFLMITKKPVVTFKISQGVGEVGSRALKLHVID